MNLMWFVPTQGDGRYLGTTKGGRETSFSYIRQIAQAVDKLGYGGILIPTGAFCEHPCAIAAAAAASAEPRGEITAHLQFPEQRRAAP